MGAEVSYYTQAADKGNKIYWVSFFYGVAVMAPWNAVLSTLDFFENATPNYPISFVVTFGINGVMVVCVVIAIAYQEKGSHASKVNLIFFLTSFLLILLPLVVTLTKDRVGELACFWIILLMLSFIGAATAISQAAVLSYMSKLPERYMAINSVAMGVSALIQNAIRCVTLLTFGEGSEDNS